GGTPAPIEQQRDGGGIDAGHAGEVDREPLREVRAGNVPVGLGDHAVERLKIELPGDAQHFAFGRGAHFAPALADCSERLRSCSVFTSPSMPARWIWSLNEPR